MTNVVYHKPNKNTENHVSIMDIHFISTTKTNLLSDELIPRLKNKEKCFIVTANPEIVMQTKEDAQFKHIVQTADFVVPDGVGIVIASKHKKQPIKERIPGFDLMLDLLKYANDNQLSCYFLGAKDYINNKAVSEINRRFPYLKVAGHHHGYFKGKESEVLREMKATKADLVFVALGSPQQERWIHKNIDQFSHGLFMGVGGSFDVLSGEVKRAPEKWIKLNLEWLYRLLKEPFRWKRILKVIEFMIRIYIKKE
ncbi:WecB/TagA/CpsF family glycosyltransferase [Ornithinibacillus sp. L9]|uniref:N-acetylglucosaminyldiphosphoundecaprenol N-acetyl-beta-D-mannosaminyltransferase n=1 Tax=Ornithinibacillus caprae TaxID=2678566 RepID=A0A6N8FCT4_9BACI|nr:WecB/TagA/CpsF family glycosyltransferase [Ornithinibacillus caprae]MUK87370.1 WecB/TagA/CpsF family glycosyltransferase [Ornithinibacillus caprae]